MFTSSPDHPLTLDMAGEIAARPDVEQVETTDILPVVLLGPDGDAYQSGGAGTWLLPYVPPVDMITETFTVSEGRVPEGPGEAVINSGAAERGELQVGDTVTVIDSVGRTDYTLVGITEAGIASGGWAGVQVSEEVFRADYAPTGTTGRILLRGDVALDTLRGLCCKNREA